MKFYTRHSATVNRNITDRAFALPVKIATKREHILRRPFFITTSQGPIDGFEVEAGGLDLAQIFDGAVVGVDDEVVPGVDQAGGVEDGADVGLAVLRFERCQAA